MRTHTEAAIRDGMRAMFERTPPVVRPRPRVSMRLVPFALMPSSPRSPLLAAYNLWSQADFTGCLAELDALDVTLASTDRVEAALLRARSYLRVERASAAVKALQCHRSGTPLRGKRVGWRRPSAKCCGYVPFPDGPFYYCSSSAKAPCLDRKERAKFKDILLAAHVVPPAGFQAHHIHPIGWCGKNDVDNGVFLPAHAADANEYDPKTHSRFNVWWFPGNFKPDDTVIRCDEAS